MKRGQVKNELETRPVAAFNQKVLEEFAASIDAILEGVQTVLMAAGGITDALTQYRVLSIQEQWVSTWGETVNKKTAAAMLGVSPGQITKLVTAGTLHVTPDGRVLVRQAADWANSRQPEQSRKQAPRHTGKKFIP